MVDTGEIPDSSCPSRCQDAYCALCCSVNVSTHLVFFVDVSRAVQHRPFLFLSLSYYFVVARYSFFLRRPAEVLYRAGVTRWRRTT